MFRRVRQVAAPEAKSTFAYFILFFDADSFKVKWRNAQQENIFAYAASQKHARTKSRPRLEIGNK